MSLILTIATIAIVVAFLALFACCRVSAGADARFAGLDFKVCASFTSKAARLGLKGWLT